MPLFKSSNSRSRRNSNVRVVLPVSSTTTTMRIRHPADRRKEQRPIFRTSLVSGLGLVAFLSGCLNLGFLYEIYWVGAAGADGELQLDPIKDSNNDSGRLLEYDSNHALLKQEAQEVTSDASHLADSTVVGGEQQPEKASDEDSAIKSPKVEFVVHTATDGGAEELKVDVVDNDNNASKLYFVVHVGPGKTATTSLQTDFTVMKDDILLRDNYYYDGKNGPVAYGHQYPLIHFLRDTDCQEESYLARQEGRPRPRCYEAFINRLRYKHAGTNILISEEFLTFGRYLVTLGSRRTVVDWEGLQEALWEAGEWHLLIVVAYRRLVDWWPSARAQYQRSDKDFKPWPKNGGRFTEPLFPTILQHINGEHNEPLGLWTKQTLDMFPPSMRNHPTTTIKILNYHDNEEQSLKTTFLCDIVPNAPRSCALSRIDDGSLEETHNNPFRETQFYDVLATNAAEMGLVDTEEWTRHEMTQELLKHQTAELNRTQWDFPLTCPSEEDLSLFLEESLRQEEILMPDFYARKAEEHRQKFWDAAAKHKYCWINVEETLALPEWRTFFEEVDANSESKEDDAY